MGTNNPINKKTSALTVNAAYSLPTADGSANDVLHTNGAGVASWSAVSSIGRLVQSVWTSYTGAVSINAAIPIDDTIPQNTEGVEVMTQAITPTSATNALEITCFIPYTLGPSSGHFIAALFQDTTANAIAAQVIDYNVTASESEQSCRYFFHKMLAGTTSETTFKLRLGRINATTTYFNGTGAGGREFGGVQYAWISIHEIIP